MTKREGVRLEEWTYAWGRLSGKVYGHENFPDGTVVTTSPVINMDIEGAETLNTFYTLGKPLNPEN